MDLGGWKNRILVIDTRPRSMEVEQGSLKGEGGAKRDRLGNAVRETNAISRLSRRNFNGADDIHRFADVGNEIGLACQWHTNKRYAGRQAHGHALFSSLNVTRPIREQRIFVREPWENGLRSLRKIFPRFYIARMSPKSSTKCQFVESVSCFVWF